jgi:uncharacterized protein (DUF1330 family)
MSKLTLAVVARIPIAGVADFQAYESAVLALLAGHGGNLERRLRSTDGTQEIHIVSFASEAGFASFRSDPQRQAAAPLLARSGATTEVAVMLDVD